ncbi:MAG: multiprotein bridging factor aMBF1 [Desulfurococcales archaeon]|nr:multiprotein bridging factor aMBF1 [Desulfurococcales archaeon]
MVKSFQTCELCGRPIYGKAYKVVVEGVELTVCASCYLKLLKDKGLAKKSEKDSLSKRGLVRSKKSVGRPRPRRRAENYDVVEDYAKIIREARERLGLTRAELARKVQEREVTLGKIETGRLMPTIDLARRLERVLKVRLLEPVVDDEEEQEIASNPSGKSVLTLGDVAVLKKKDEEE